MSLMVVAEEDEQEQDFQIDLQQLLHAHQAA